MNSKLDLIRTVKFVKQLFRIQIKKGGKVLLWNQVRSRMKTCYSELILKKLPTGTKLIRKFTYTMIKIASNWCKFVTITYQVSY